MNITFMDYDAGYWTDIYGVYRWDSNMVTRPGTYRVVVSSGPAFALAKMGCDEPWQFSHPTCVVDDFGSLVKVHE